MARPSRLGRRFLAGKMRYTVQANSSSVRKVNLKRGQSESVGVENDPSRRWLRSVSEMRVARQGRERQPRGVRRRDRQAPAISNPEGCGGVPNAVLPGGGWFQILWRRSKVSFKFSTHSSPIAHNFLVLRRSNRSRNRKSPRTSIAVRSGHASKRTI
jgi:hypothetical protein